MITDEERHELDRFTPKQRRWLLRRKHGLFAWLTTDATFDARLRTFKAEADARERAELRAEQERAAEEALATQRNYFDTISRVTTYDGPDYRVRFPGQPSWIRAVRWQYDAALERGVERSIGVPEITLAATKALTS